MFEAGFLSVSFVLNLMMAMGTAPDIESTTSLWKTVAATGRVESSLPSEADQTWLPLHRGSQVAPLSRVRTFERARTTLTRQGDLILVAAGSEVVLPERTPDGTTVVLQQTGHAIYKVAPRTGGGRFEVRTPFLVAGVKGTRFSVILEKDRAAVSVLEGVVEVRSSLTGEATDLTAGMVAVVDGRPGRIETYEDSGRVQPGARDGKENRGKKEIASVRTSDTTDEIGKEALAETLRSSEKLAASLVQVDDSLSLLTEERDDDLWGDLLTDEKSITRSTTQVLDQTTTKLDPITSDPKSDPGLITRLLDLLK